MTNARSALVRERVLALVGSPEAGHRLSPGLLEAVNGLDIWIWGPVPGERRAHEEVLDEWRRLELEPSTVSYAFQDLLVYAALAQDWDAVATCAIAVAANRDRGGSIHAAWTRSPSSRWVAADFAPPMAQHEARALAACANAWDLRADRLRRARRADLISTR